MNKWPSAGQLDLEPVRTAAVEYIDTLIENLDRIWEDRTVKLRQT
jgi:hypothetical protein